MSRSYRRPYSPVTGCRSAASDKMVARRAHRRMQNQRLQQYISNGKDWDEFLNPERLEASFNEVYCWGRDGNQSLQCWNHNYANPFWLNSYNTCTVEEQIQHAEERVRDHWKWIAEISRK